MTRSWDRAELKKNSSSTQGYSFKTGKGGCFIYYIETNTETQTEEYAPNERTR